MANKFSVLRQRMSPKAKARSEVKAQAMLAETAARPPEREAGGLTDAAPNPGSPRTPPLPTKQRRNIADALAMPGIADIEFKPPRVIIEPVPADF